MKSFSLNRRAVIRGAGVTMALPLLEAMLPPGKTAFAADARPPRFLAYFTPCGLVHQNYEMPYGPINQLSPTLADFEDLKGQISQIRGVASPLSGGGGDIAQGCQSWLRAGSTGASVDQVAHKLHMEGPLSSGGERTRLGSVVVGLNGNCFPIGGSTPFAACAISWVDTNNPAVKDHDPLAFFNKLFRNPSSDRLPGSHAALDMDNSVLSYVKDEAKKLQQKMGANDKQIIEQYFTSVEDLERRLNSMLPPISACTSPIPPDPSISLPPTPGSRSPLVARAFADLTVLSFQCDLARYGSFMLENAEDAATYSHLGVTAPHFDLSHAAPSDALAKVERWMLGEMAYLVRGLKNAKDVTGASLLDSCTVMLGSEVSDGARHNHDNMPFMIAGSCNGYFKMGQTIQSGGNYGDVWVQVMDALGYRLPSGKFGNSTGRIPIEIMA